MQEVTDKQDRLSGNHMLSELYRALADLLGPDRYELWLGQQATFSLGGGSLDGIGASDASLSQSDDLTLHVGCPTQFQLEWLRRRLHQPLNTCCQQVWQREVNVVFHITQTSGGPQTSGESQTAGLHLSSGPVISGSADNRTSGSGVLDYGAPIKGKSGNESADALTVGTTLSAPSQGEHATARSGSAARSARSSRSKPATRSPQSAQSALPSQSRASSHLHFGTFVVGKANELAHNTAKIVAQQPGRYCPLLLHGPSGVGKTHLLSAIRHQIRTQSPRAYVIQMTSEQFTTQFLEALDRRGLPGFRQKHRTAHVLLIDDIHFFAGKRATLEELLYTIDTLHERGSQIVLTSDRTLGQLQSISPNLTARISSGLSVPVDYPDYETRVGIVRQLALKMQIDLDDQVAMMIATRVAGSARQLSGALNRLLAGSMALGQPITPQLAESALAEFAQQSAPPVRLSDIQRAVCEVFGVEPSSLKSSRKSRNVAEPRMLAMWLARKYTRAALSEISDFFGRRSHSTVISAQKKVETLLNRHSEITVADTPCPMEEAIQRVESALRNAS